MLTPNVVDLSLPFKQTIIRGLFDNSVYPFTLRRLCMSGISSEHFATFFRVQNQIEALDLLEGPHYHEEPLPPRSAPLEPGVLPLLKSVRSIGSTVQHLVPNRPVSSVYIWDTLAPTELSLAIDAIFQSTVPLVALRIGLGIPPYDWDVHIPAFLTSIKRARESLRELTIGFGPVSYDGWVMETSVEDFLWFRRVRASLSGFTSLESFTLEHPFYGGNPLSPELYKLIPELSQFRLWNESCPSLQKVDVFEVVLKRS
ncbi:hypothetical protein FS749_004140 [Ceratobasidium sp. UAMH 11750]|nr:hypothetical protein FS749_004140 [Ceratobasidium sp. UAMH 11750]